MSSLNFETDHCAWVVTNKTLDDNLNKEFEVRVIELTTFSKIGRPFKITHLF